MADAFAIQKGEKPVAVSIRFAPRQARWIRERRWHKTARVQERLDGGLVLQLRVAETSEIRRWVTTASGADSRFQVVPFLVPHLGPGG